MTTKILVINESTENNLVRINFNFGISSSKDAKFIQSIINYFIKCKLYPKDENFSHIFKLMNLYAKLSSDDNVRIENRVDEDKIIKYYRRILKFYNVMIHNEIIDLVNRSEESNKLTSILNSIQYRLPNKEVIYEFFLITCAYISSKLFAEHYEKAKKGKIIFNK